MKIFRYLITLHLFLVSVHSLLGQSRIDNFEEYLERDLQEKRIPGAMISIVSSDSILFAKGVGKVKDSLYYSGNRMFCKNEERESSVLLFQDDKGKSGVWINDNYTIKASRTKRIFLLFGVALSLLVYASFMLYTAFFFFVSFFSKSKKPTWLHLILFVSGICFVLMFLGFGLSMENRQSGSEANLYSITMFLSSFSLVILSFASLIGCLNLLRNRRLYLYCCLASIAAVFLSTYAWEIGFVGLKLWSY